MGIHIHIHHHFVNENLIIQKLNAMSEIVNQLKAKLESQGTALDSIGTNVTGIQADVTALKARIADLLANGATAAEVAELDALVNGISSKVDVIGTTTASLDAETDPGNV